MARKKFGQAFQTQLRHYANLRRIVAKELAESLRKLTAARNKTALDRRIITLADFLLECNTVIVDCFKGGYISSGIHELRLAQEITQQICAFFHQPQLLKQKRLPLKDARRALGEEAFRGWARFYGDLTKVSHIDRRFLERIYPMLSLDAPINSTCLILMEFYLTLLNNCNLKALYVVNKRLQPKVGSTYKSLVEEYNRLHEAVDADWSQLESKERSLLRC